MQRKRNVLIVGVTPEEFGQAAPFLSRGDLDVDRFPTPRGASALIKKVPFALIIVRVPLPEMELTPQERQFLAAGSFNRTQFPIAAALFRERESSGY